MELVYDGHTMNMSKMTDAPSHIYTYTGNVINDDTRNSDTEAATNITNMTHTSAVTVSTGNTGKSVPQQLINQSILGIANQININQCTINIVNVDF